MNEEQITAVCISREPQSFSVEIHFLSYTEGYRDVPKHNLDMGRIIYLTNRYNSAINQAITKYPLTKHILVLDHYYLKYTSQIKILINDYIKLEKVILGGAIWYWNRQGIRSRIGYYDTLSIPEFVKLRYKNINSLPVGIIPVTGVGACWIFPRSIWEKTNGFTIPSPAQAGGSRCLDTQDYSILLDYNCRLWRTHDTNTDIPDNSMAKRILVSSTRLLNRLRYN